MTIGSQQWTGSLRARQRRKADFRLHSCRILKDPNAHVQPCYVTLLNQTSVYVAIPIEAMAGTSHSEHSRADVTVGAFSSDELPLRNYTHVTEPRCQKWPPSSILRDSRQSVTSRESAGLADLSS